MSQLNTKISNKQSVRYSIKICVHADDKCEVLMWKSLVCFLLRFPIELCVVHYILPKKIENVCLFEHWDFFFVLVPFKVLKILIAVLDREYSFKVHCLIEVFK